jgi:asparagine synthase (glutamine-hydrolysing)
MRDAMTYGGPDDCGHYYDSSEIMALGHRRLSILDLSASGKQPMSYENLHLVYNGEVYNFLEIRAEHESLGYTFFSSTDTEVILKSYHRWGMNCVKKFRGMWAFAIYDSSNKKLILCRDRIGVKPLFWYYKGRMFMFSSEMKGFHANPDFR